MAHLQPKMEKASARKMNSTSNATKQNIIVEGLRVLIQFCIAISISIFRFFISPSRKSVKNEVVLVTGSGQGMGRQLSLEFSKLGARVVLWDINDRENEETSRQIRELGGVCHTYRCDVSNREEVYSVGGRVQAEVGDVTILINNAGVISGQKLLDIPDDKIEQTFKVNLLAHFWTTKCFLPSMMTRNRGHVVNMCSSTGLIGLTGLTDYSASKFGVVGFTEVLNYELVYSGHSGIHTTLVCPSFVKTGMFDGCQMKYPVVIPPLEVSDTVDRIMKAILTNQHMVCVPRIVYSFNLLKSLLPVSAMLGVYKFLGAANFMDTFVGRRDRILTNGHGSHHGNRGQSGVAMTTNAMTNGRKMD